MILMGAIAGVHGIKGEVKVKSFTADPLSIASYGPLYDEAGRRLVLTLTQKAAKDSVVVARVDGVVDRNAAEALKGRRLYAPREALPATESADEFYASDLIGLSVEDRGGQGLGTVTDVQDYGGGPILAISGDARGAFDLPFTDAFVPVVDLVVGRLVIDLPDDFFVAPEKGDGDEGGD